MSSQNTGLRPAVLAAVVLGLVLTGCGGGNAASPKADPTSGPSTPAVSDTAPVVTPVPSVETTAPSATPSQAPATLTDRLLATAEVPGLNAQWHWQDGRTGPAGNQAFGLCAKFDLGSIGATEVVERTYFPPVDTDDNAAEQVAELPDLTTTSTALKVLKSWRQQCGTTTRRVSPLTSAAGGIWYLVSVRPAKNPDGALVQAVGIVARGSRIAVLTMDSVGKDYDYPSGQEPIVAMIRAAAARLA